MQLEHAGIHSHSWTCGKHMQKASCLHGLKLTAPRNANELSGSIKIKTRLKDDEVWKTKYFLFQRMIRPATWSTLLFQRLCKTWTFLNRNFWNYMGMSFSIVTLKMHWSYLISRSHWSSVLASSSFKSFNQILQTSQSQVQFVQSLSVDQSVSQSQSIN